MSSIDSLRLKLESLSNSATPVVVEIGNDFFSAIEQEEILGGVLAVNIAVQKKAGSSYDICYSVKGQVTVTCDRCLDPMSYDIEAEDTYNVATIDENGYELLSRDGDYDASWDVYEIIELSLPLQRCHEEGQCNPEQTELLGNLSVEN